MLAHGYALGASLAFLNAEVWNALPTPEPHQAELLAHFWSTRDNGGWAEQVHILLAGRNIGGDGEDVLQVRMKALAQTGLQSITVPEWLSAVESLATVSDSWGNHAIERAKKRVQRIARYEARLRADGILPPDGFVTSVLAYDYGRASAMARWGYGSNLCTREEAENVIAAASMRARRTYVSWPHFSASYILGRILRFDHDSIGDYYTNAVRAHTALFSEPDSPWRNLPFH